MARKGGIIKTDYFKFLSEIKQKIVSSRINAYRGLNRELIRLYWEIGKTIVDRQQKYGWGEGGVPMPKHGSREII